MVRVPTVLPLTTTPVVGAATTPVLVMVTLLLFQITHAVHVLTVVSLLTVTQALACDGKNVPKAVTKVKADVLRRRERWRFIEKGGRLDKNKNRRFFQEKRKKTPTRFYFAGM